VPAVFIGPGSVAEQALDCASTSICADFFERPVISTILSTNSAFACIQVLSSEVQDLRPVVTVAHRQPGFARCAACAASTASRISLRLPSPTWPTISPCAQHGQGICAVRPDLLAANVHLGRTVKGGRSCPSARGVVGMAVWLAHARPNAFFACFRRGKIGSRALHPARAYVFEQAFPAAFAPKTLSR